MCNIRIASVITDAPLYATPRKGDDPYSNCLYYAEDACRECEVRCPGDAITREGHDKIKCWKYGQVVSREMKERLETLLKPHSRRINGKESVAYPVGCAFCQFDVPCMERNPVAKG